MNLQVGNSEIAARTLAVIEDLRDLEGPLLPILHALQAEFGYVPQDCLPVIGRELNLSRAEVHGVITFYHDFRKEPAGRHVLKLCRAEACQAMGGDALAERVKALLGIDFHETTADGAITLEPVYCLGLCSTAPAALLDGAVHGRLDIDAVRDILSEVQA